MRLCGVRDLRVVGRYDDSELKEMIFDFCSII